MVLLRGLKVPKQDPLNPHPRNYGVLATLAHRNDGACLSGLVLVDLTPLRIYIFYSVDEDVTKWKNNTIS